MFEVFSVRYFGVHSTSRIYASILISTNIGGWKHLLTLGEQSNQNYANCTTIICGLDEVEHDCSNTWYMSSESLMTWNIINWTLLAFCLISLICKLLIDFTTPFCK